MHQNQNIISPTAIMLLIKFGQDWYIVSSKKIALYRKVMEIFPDAQGQLTPQSKIEF